MIDTTEKPINNSFKSRSAIQQQICLLYCRNNELVAYTDRESLVLHDSNVLELYSNDEGPSRTTVTEGSQLSGLPKTILQKAKAIFPRSRPILFRFLWLQPRTLVVLTVRLDLS